MKDQEIVRLFWERSPQAVPALEETYGLQLRRLAGNLLSSPQDAEECLNDAYLGLWDSIPPARPEPLLPYALRVVRNLCLKRYHWNNAQKRNSQFDLAFPSWRAVWQGLPARRQPRITTSFGRRWRSFSGS